MTNKPTQELSEAIAELHKSMHRLHLSIIISCLLAIAIITGLGVLFLLLAGH